MKIGIVVLGLMFLISGVFNIIKPQLSYRPGPDNPEQEPTEDYISKKRRMGILWCAIGAMVTYYGVLYFLGRA